MGSIGLIGGMSWESTSVYYRLLNERCASALGGLHSAEVPAALGGLRRDRGAAARRALGRAGAAMLASGAPARARRGRLPRALHQHHAQAAPTQIAGGGPHPPPAHRRRHRRGGARAPGCARRPARRRASPWSRTSTAVGCARATASRRWCRSEPTGRRCTASSTTSCAWASWRTGVAPAYRADHRPACGARRRGRDPGLHGDRPAGRPGRRSGAGVRHHAAARPRPRSTRARGVSPCSR